MFRYVFIFFILVCLGCHKQKKEVLIDKINTFNKNFNDHNYAINKMINKEIGLTLIYTIGSNPSFLKVNELSFKKGELNSMGFPFWWEDELLKLKLPINLKQFKTLKENPFKCDSILNEGLFRVTNQDVNILSQIINEKINDDEFLEICSEDIKSKNKLKNNLEKEFVIFKKIEKNSVRIIYTAKKDNTIFVMHFTKIDGEWFVYLIDFYSFDCSV